MADSIVLCDGTPAADVNASRLSVAKECLPSASTIWTIQQPNEISAFSADFTKVARTPISTDRAGRKGTVSNVEVAPAFQTDVTLDTFRYWGDGFLYSKWEGAGNVDLDVSGATATGYTVTANGALAEGSLVFAKGFGIAANNGLKTVVTGSTATEVKVSGLSVEASPPADAQLYYVGVSGVAADITIDSNGNLTSTALDFTGLGLEVGQYIYIDGFTTQTVTSKLARVGAVAAHLLTLENSEFVAEVGTGKTIKIYVSSFARNVPVDNADFYREQYTMEMRYNTATPIYENARGVSANQMTINAPLTDKMTMDLTFVAQDLEAPTPTPLPSLAYQNFDNNEAYNTVTNLNRIRLTNVDESGLSTFLKDVTVTINNNVAGENVLGVMGAAFTNIGNLEVTMDTETVMTDGAVLAAIRNNATVGFELAGVNGDGAIIINIPTMTLGDGSKNLSAGEKVKVAVTGTGYLDEEVGFVVGFSVFPYLPA